MGIDMRRARFAGPVPTLSQLVAKAEALGGLPLAHEEADVAFAAFPEWRVHVSQEESTPAIDLSDHDANAPALMDLLEHALVALGGDMGPRTHYQPMPVPMTLQDVVQRRRRYRRLAAVGSLLVLLGVGLLVVLPVAVGLALWFGLRLLFAG